MTFTAFLIAIILPAALLLAAGAVYQRLGLLRDARAHPPPGRLIPVDGFRLHLFETGRGEPAVILDSGIAASSLSWSLVQPAVAEITRVCSYDRAGLGWSDPSPAPRTCEHIAQELRVLLSRGGIPGPYVLVGHSFGGAVCRVYAERYPGEVAGMVLVDALRPEEWLHAPRARLRELRGAVLLSRLGGWLARFGIVRACLDLLVGGRIGIPSRFIRIFGPKASSLLRRIVGEVQKLPPRVLPEVRSRWCLPRCFRAMADHLAALPASAAELAHAGPLGDIPLVVVSAGDHTPEERRAHEAMASLSSRGRHVVAEGSGHWIHLDRPDVVVESIREVVEAVRRRR